MDGFARFLGCVVVGKTRSSRELETVREDCATEQRYQPSRWKFIASVLIIGHVWAVFGRPIEFATQGPTGVSPAASSFYTPVRGYSEFTYLNHGYAFFAPDPGPSHLMRVQFEKPDEDGRNVSQEWMFPDLKEQWPRLLYHRHFMLAEFLHNTYQPRSFPGPTPDDPAVLEAWNKGRARHEAILDSITNHLKKRAGVDELRLRRVEHQLVGLPEFLNGQNRLDDPLLYLELSDEADSYMEIPRFGVPPQGRPIFGGER